MQKRVESWDIRAWSVEKIREKVNSIFKRKEISIESLSITPQTLEVTYFEKIPEEDKINPSER